MSKIDETGKVVGKEVGTFLSDKPIWVWWIVYTVMIGVIFGIFYIAIYVLTVKWWTTLIIILAAGLIWGTFAYYNKEKGKKAELSGQSKAKAE